MGDVITGLAGATLSVFYLYGAAAVKVFGGSATAGVNAQTVPKLWGGCFLVLSVVLIARGALALRKRGESSARHLFDRLRDRREVVATFALLICYAALMKPVGFILASGAYIYLQIRVLTPPEKRTRRMHLTAATLALVFPIGLFQLFTKYLTVMLPAGLLK